MTFDQTAVKNAIDALQSRGNTDIAAGINVATSHQTSSARPEAIVAQILLSDGNPTVPNGVVNAIAAATNAAANNIIIFTIALGSDANTTLMQQIASITGGTYYFAPSGSDLEAIYDQISEQIFNTAGVDVVVTDVIPPHAEYVSGSLTSRHA